MSHFEKSPYISHGHQAKIAGWFLSFAKGQSFFFSLSLNVFFDSQENFFFLSLLVWEPNWENAQKYNNPNTWPTGSWIRVEVITRETFRAWERCLFMSSLTTYPWHGFKFLKYPTVPCLTYQENCLHNEGEFYYSYNLQLVQGDEKRVGVGDLERSHVSAKLINLKFVKVRPLFIDFRKPSTQELRCFSINVILFQVCYVNKWQWREDMKWVCFWTWLIIGGNPCGDTREQIWDKFAWVEKDVLKGAKRREVKMKLLIVDAQVHPTARKDAWGSKEK